MNILVILLIFQGGNNADIWIYKIMAWHDGKDLYKLCRETPFLFQRGTESSQSGTQ